MQLFYSCEMSCALSPFPLIALSEVRLGSAHAMRILNQVKMLFFLLALLPSLQTKVLNLLASLPVYAVPLLTRLGGQKINRYSLNEACLFACLLNITSFIPDLIVPEPLCPWPWKLVFTKILRVPWSASPRSHGNIRNVLACTLETTCIPTSSLQVACKDSISKGN